MEHDGSAWVGEGAIGRGVQDLVVEGVDSLCAEGGGGVGREQQTSERASELRLDGCVCCRIVSCKQQLSKLHVGVSLERVVGGIGCLLKEELGCLRKSGELGALAH